ncbi:hypothetical protein Peur_023355 [Populus x canadensis]
MNGLFRFSVLGGILIDGGLYGVLWGRSKAEKQEIHNKEIVDLEKEKASSEIAGFWFVKNALSVIVGHPSYLACCYTDCEFH